MKYVIFDHEGLPVPVTFSDVISHDQVKPTIGPEKKPLKAVSAGFCTVRRSGGVVVFGCSVSLNLSPRPEDPAILELHLHAQGVFTKAA